MKKGCDGFIFLMTLCIICVISLLLLTCMQHVLLYSKAINRLELQHQRFYQLEDLVMQLAQNKSFVIDKECLVHEVNADKVIRKLVNNEGCSLINGELHYKYLIEDLGEFPCLVVQQNDQIYATQHERITVLQSADDINPTTSILQVRNIKQSSPLTCQTEEHRISTGISSWRYVPDYQ